MNGRYVVTRWRWEALNTQRGFVLWLAVGALLWVTVLSLWALLA